MLHTPDVLSRIETGLRTCLPAWGLAAESPLRLLTVSENATYLVEPRTGPPLVFRVHRPGYHDGTEIQSELNWILALRAAQVVRTAAPVPKMDGDYLNSFKNGDNTHYVACFAFMPGQAPTVDGRLPEWFRHLGGIAARLHDHVRHFPLPPNFSRKRWTHDTLIGAAAYWGDWRAAPGLTQAGRAVLEQADQALHRGLADFGTGPDRFGLIHCDMRAANLLVDGEDMTVIDFDDCGFCWFGYDFAAAVSFIEHDPVVPSLMSAWVQGYRAIAPLDQAMIDALPMFVLLRRMQLTAWIASHHDTATAEQMGPEYTHGTVMLARQWLTRTTDTCYNSRI
ncbi:MAG TPA: phosphotransferase [Paenirhodobacter sp.]